MRATELAVEATMDSAGTPSDVCVSLSKETSHHKHLVPRSITHGLYRCSQIFPTEYRIFDRNIYLTAGPSQENLIKWPRYSLNKISPPPPPRSSGT